MAEHKGFWSKDVDVERAAKIRDTRLRSGRYLTDRELEMLILYRALQTRDAGIAVGSTAKVFLMMLDTAKLTVVDEWAIRHWGMMYDTGEKP